MSQKNKELPFNSLCSIFVYFQKDLAKTFYHALLCPFLLGNIN